MAFLFAYSMRGKTRAYHRMEDDVPEDVKKRRLQELIEIFHRRAAERNAARHGQTFVVMVDGERCGRGASLIEPWDDAGSLFLLNVS